MIIPEPGWCPISKTDLFPVAILAGGLANRLRPITRTIPKSLLEIQGEPFISHQLRLLRSRGVQEVVICAGYLGEMIQETVRGGEKWGLEVNYSFDGDRLLGTAGAIKRALPFLGRAFLVLYGDSYLTCDYQAVQGAFVRKGRPALMTVFRNRGLYDHSNITWREGEIIRYDKEDPTADMEYIDYGLSAFRQEAFAGIPENEPGDLSCLYRDLLAKGQLAGFEVQERFYEIGSFDGLEEMRAYASENLVEPRRKTDELQH